MTQPDTTLFAAMLHTFEALETPEEDLPGNEDLDEEHDDERSSRED